MSIQLSDSDQIPLLIDVKKDKKSSEICIYNGSERIILNHIQYTEDSIFVSFPAFASEFRAKVHSKKYISGHWYNHAKKGNYFLPFWTKLEFAEKYPVEKPSIDINGKWEVTFDYDEENPEKSIGIFQYESKVGYNKKELFNRVTGTFLTETGDYRFLEGATINDSLYLSTFDGSHAFLFKAQLKNDTLWGKFLSGKHYQSNWYAVKNENFELGHPDSLTFLQNDKTIQFELPDLDGNLYTYPNDQLKGKAHLIQIMGTWCPNCLDESMYLREVYDKHQGQIEIIAVTFETQKALSAKIEKVDSYRRNLSLNYQFVIGGDACKPCATKLFPMLNEIISFPTLLFIDKKGEVRKIHTGFNGPGTGVYYDQFVESTNAFIDVLIHE